MPILYKKRLQLQPTIVRTGIDRLIKFLSPDTTEEERRSTRGVVIIAKDKAEAKRKYRALEAAAEDAVYNNQVPQFLDELDRRHRPTHVETGPLFEEFAGEWEQTCVINGGLRESTIESDTSTLKNYLIPFFGKEGMKVINARLVDRFKATKRRAKHQYGVGYSAKTINNHLSVLHRIFEKAIEYGIVDKNPVTKKAWLKRETTPEESENWWSPDEELAAIAKLLRIREARDGLRKAQSSEEAMESIEKYSGKPAG